jgi:2-polyprenyl-3-methyl-5-hydroxy-6-metoxy-1,4-benzoquinol methylase
LTALLNKTKSRADLERPDAQAIERELDDLDRALEDIGVRPSTWYGELEAGGEGADWERANRGLDYAALPGAADDDRYPWFLYWEIAWLLLGNDYRSGQRLLDLGGSGSLFSCLLASRGIEVTSVDLNQDVVDRGDVIAAETGWPMRSLVMDMRRLSFDERFDHAASVCVFEHLPLTGRVQASRELAEVLNPGGTFSLTFDYVNPSPTAKISSPAAVHAQFVQPSGLRVRGNAEFHDTGERYLLHPAYHPDAEERGGRRGGDPAPPSG